MTKILVPGDRRTKEPTKAEQLLFRLAASQQQIEVMSLNLQNNLVALKNILNITDDQMKAELDRMNDEMKINQDSQVSKETQAAVAALEPLPIEDSE